MAIRSNQPLLIALGWWLYFRAPLKLTIASPGRR
jgi:hypothetical protein